MYLHTKNKVSTLRLSKVNLDCKQDRQTQLNALPAANMTTEGNLKNIQSPEVSLVAELHITPLQKKRL